MMMRFLASPHMRRNTLALGLCLLAFLFALEAKTAWYSPANGPGRDIQSQKAFPKELPVPVPHGISKIHQATFPIDLIFLASIVSLAWTNADFQPGVDAEFNRIPVSAAPYFSPGLFFRPPPTL